MRDLNEVIREVEEFRDAVNQALDSAIKSLRAAMALVASAGAGAVAMSAATRPAVEPATAPPSAKTTPHAAQPDGVLNESVSAVPREPAQTTRNSPASSQDEPPLLREERRREPQALHLVPPAGGGMPSNLKPNSSMAMIISLLQQEGRPMTTDEFVERTGHKRGNIASALSRAFKEGRLHRPSTSTYELPAAERAGSLRDDAAHPAEEDDGTAVAIDV